MSLIPSVRRPCPSWDFIAQRVVAIRGEAFTFEKADQRVAF